MPRHNTLAEEIQSKKEVHFRSMKDFESRISKIIQDARNHEIYHFTFEYKEIEDAFGMLMDAFK
jgi:hypothetical protein